MSVHVAFIRRVSLWSERQDEFLNTYGYFNITLRTPATKSHSCVIRIFDKPRPYTLLYIVPTQIKLIKKCKDIKVYLWNEKRIYCRNVKLWDAWNDLGLEGFDRFEYATVESAWIPFAYLDISRCKKINKNLNLSHQA